MTASEKVPNETLLHSLLAVGVEGWRLSKQFSRLLQRLDAGESGRFASQLRYFQKQLGEGLDASGIQLVDLEGQPFDPGMAVMPVNVADFGPDDVLVVDQMLEPVVIGPTGVLRQGSVTLRLE